MSRTKGFMSKNTINNNNSNNNNRMNKVGNQTDIFVDHISTNNVLARIECCINSVQINLVSITNN